MVSHSIFALAAVAACILQAQASPCRPTATTVASSVAEISSTVVSEPTLTSLATTLTEATTTSVFVSETISTTLAEPTTKTAVPSVCAETQVVINPGFDSSADNVIPWVGSGYRLDTETVYSAPNALALVFENGQGSARIAQPLRNLNGKYTLSYRYIPWSGVNVGAGFACTITPKIGNQALAAVDPWEFTGWKSSTQEWSAGNENVAEAELSLSASCSGEYDQLTINIDDITLTKVCDESATQD